MDYAGIWHIISKYMILGYNKLYRNLCQISVVMVVIILVVFSIFN